MSVQPAEDMPYTFDDNEIKAINMINNDENNFKVLVQSLSPELHGQELVKAGVLLSLFGGSGSQLHNNGEINVLLVGDPGVGKSNLLEICSKISERSMLLSCKQGAAAGNQLAPCIQGRNHISIGAGALVASHQGHCTIDDIDRIASKQDALRQVLQTRSVNMSTPNLHLNLQVETAVLATANPMRGRYNSNKLLLENIRIDPALLSMFHLVFVLADKPDKELDTSLTEHIRSLHAGSKKPSLIAARFAARAKNTVNDPNYTRSLLSGGDMIDPNDESYNLTEKLRINKAEELFDEQTDEDNLLPTLMLKKFIAYARQNVRPLLSTEAAIDLKNFYMDLRRQKSDGVNSAINSCHLEGLIRLTQARARLDFSKEATKTHLRDVLCIVRHSMADTSIGALEKQLALAPSASGTSQNSLTKKFLKIIQLRSNAVGKRVFDFDELKEIARFAGISCGVTNMVDMLNMQGYLLKKGPNIYKLTED